MTDDFYDVLGVSRDASEEEIQQAYRKKAAQYHPDVSDEENAEQKFKKAKKAKEVLTDEEKRRVYDQVGHERFEQAEKRGGFDGGGSAGGAGRGDPFGGMGGGGMGGGMGGGFEDIFEQFFGGGGGRGRGQQGPSAGRDLQTRLEVDLQAAHDGTTREMTLTRPERCPDCDGAGHPPDADVRTCPQCDGRGQVTQVQQTPLGRVQQTQTCPRCDGEGEFADVDCSTCRGDGQVRREATISVDVPAGIRDGQTLRMEGEGSPGEPGAPDGDLLVEIHVADHPEFERDGDDLYRRQPLSFPQAVFGDTVAVETLGGDVELDVPAGTQSGERFRLRGKGMPRLRGGGKGDLYVEVRVVTPESLNAEQREALEAFAEAGGQNIDVDQGFFERLKNSF